MLAIQIAKQVLGASYVATTASPGIATDLCKKAGADKIVNYRSDKFEQALAGEDFDMCFDTTNEGSKMAPILKEGGAIVSVSGNPSIEAVTEGLNGKDPGLLIRLYMWATRNTGAERAALSRKGSWEYIFMKPSGKELNEIANVVDEGKMFVHLDTEAKGLENFQVAVDKMYSGRAKGKVVIKVV